MQADKKHRLSTIKNELQKYQNTAIYDHDHSDNVTIKVSGIQTVSDASDSIDMITRGGYRLLDGEYFIHYYEEDLTDEDVGSNVDIVYSPSKQKVSMRRCGSVQTDLTIEKGRRHICKYSTHYGLMLLGVTCSDIISSLNENGGSLIFEYSLDVNSALVSINKVDISIIPDEISDI